jgi:hypothetical protein
LVIGRYWLLFVAKCFTFGIIWRYLPLSVLLFAAIGRWQFRCSCRYLLPTVINCYYLLLFKWFSNALQVVFECRGDLQPDGQMAWTGLGTITA